MPKKKIAEDTENKEAENTEVEKDRTVEPRERTVPILTIESGGEIESAEYKDDLIWHSIQNAYRTHKILTGIMTGIEKSENGIAVTVVDYRGLRIIIPIDEAITIDSPERSRDYGDLELRKNKIIGNMLGTEVDFIVKGLDNKSRSVVASRKEAMARKRQMFYFEPDGTGKPKVYVGRIV